MRLAALALVALVWSPWTHQFVTPEELERQGVAEYGAATWALVRPVVTGERPGMAIAPATPQSVRVQ